MKKLILLFVAFFTLAVNSLLAQTVYITKTGKKYHTSNCQYLSQSKIEINLQDAIARGYEPCKVCKPPTNETIVQQPLVSKPKTNNSPRTSGIRIGCICNDGTRSNATGKGACSHHGGVNHWLYK
jgi:hypothetical protein